MSTKYGKTISIEEAQACMNNYGTIMSALSTRLSSLAQTPDSATPGSATPSSTQALTAMNQYFGKKGNAFIFDKDLITRFFEKEDKKGKTANYLVVLMGAQPADDTEDPAMEIKANDPTVIVVGCTMKDGTLYSLDMDDPATEHPPIDVITTFPPHDPAFENLHPMSVIFQPVI